MAIKYRVLSGTYQGIDPRVKKKPNETPEMYARRATKLYAARGMRERIEQRGENPQLLHALGGTTDIVESDIDLCQLFNSADPNASPKFERVVETDGTFVGAGLLHQLPNESLADFAKRVQEVAAAPQGENSPVQQAAEAGFATTHTDSGRQPPGASDPFDDMTVEELKKHAEEEEIDLGNAKSKKDIVARLRSLQPA